MGPGACGAGAQFPWVYRVSHGPALSWHVMSPGPVRVLPGGCLPRGPRSFLTPFHSHFILGTHSPFLCLFCIVAYTVKCQSSTGHVLSEVSLPCVYPPRGKGVAVGRGGAASHEQVHTLLSYLLPSETVAPDALSGTLQ